jgi:mono/diheme cytochrome c family protein
MSATPHRGLAAAVFLLAVAGSAGAAPPTKATLELYATHCQVCHGAQGVAPDADRNLADEKWLHGDSLAAVVKVITEGVPGKAMLSFKDQLTAPQIAALARYVRTLAPRPKAGAAAKGKR